MRSVVAPIQLSTTGPRGQRSPGENRMQEESRRATAREKGRALLIMMRLSSMECGVAPTGADAQGPRNEPPGKARLVSRQSQTPSWPGRSEIPEAKRRGPHRVARRPEVTPATGWQRPKEGERRAVRLAVVRIGYVHLFRCL